MPRAALCAGAMEMIAKSLGANRDTQDQAFMVGMFSLLEPLFAAQHTYTMRSGICDYEVYVLERGQ